MLALKKRKKLLDFGFHHFEVKTLIPAQQAIPNNEYFSLPNALERSLPVVVSKPIRLPINKEELNQYTYQVTYKKHLQAPIKQGTVVGEVRVLYRGEEIKGMEPVPLISKTDMEKGSWLRLQLKNGEINSIIFLSKTDTSKAINFMLR